MRRRVCTETVHIRCDARAYRAQAQNGQDSPANSTNFAIYIACSGSIGFVFQTAAELSDRGRSNRRRLIEIAGWRRGVASSLYVRLAFSSHDLMFI